MEIGEYIHIRHGDLLSISLSLLLLCYVDFWNMICNFRRYDMPFLYTQYSIPCTNTKLGFNLWVLLR